MSPRQHATRLHGRPAAAHAPLQLRLMRGLFASLGRPLPGLMGRWAYRLWFRTRRYPEPAAGRRAAERATRTTLTVDSIPVAVYSWGEGPVVLFVHGWSGRGSQVAAFIEPLNAAGYRVLAVDAPGHGDTPGERTNILECARVLDAVGKEYGPLHAAITHSFGGMVLAYAMNHGLMVGRAVCLSAPARVEFLVERFARTLAMPAGVVAVLRRRMERRFDNNIWELISTDTNARRLSAPALIIHDADDAGVPWEQGRLIADAWPEARFVRTEGLGHNRILRDPGVVRQVVAFITV
ncbi:MAG: alpha/beta fold hydrolase [Gammaproteobacteria bacterium]|jgi:pimeloyl-ACP methyl ester carboxylesterase